MIEVMDQKYRICGICGKRFAIAAGNQKYCSEACKRESIRINVSLNRNTKVRKIDSSDLEAIALAATNAGMSYGKYVAREGL